MQWMRLEALPLHFASNSGEIGSSFGGLRFTGVFGSNLAAIVKALIDSL